MELVMGKLVNMQGREMGVIDGTPVLQPQCREEYLAVVKMFLPEAEYVAVLCGILDKAYYKEIEYRQQVIVNRYFEFPN
jgi:hypothetical protein